MTRPRLTAVSDTKANAIVIEADGSVVLGVSGPRTRIPSAITATTDPLTTHRTICGVLTIRVPGARGGRCITPGSGTSITNPITTVITTKNLQNRSCNGKSATPPLMLKIVASSMSWSTDDRIVSW